GYLRSRAPGVDELPIGIRLCAGELGILRRKLRLLDRYAGSQAVDAHDAAARRLDQSPLRLAGERIGVDAPQITQGDGRVRIAEQCFQRLRELIGRTGIALVVAADG